MDIINRITNICKEKGIKQQTICTALGITAGTFSTWKARGTDPEAKYIPRICEVLGVSMEYLVTGQERVSYSSNQSHMSPEQHESTNSGGLKHKKANTVLERVVSLIEEKFESDEAFENTVKLRPGTVDMLRNGQEEDSIRCAIDEVANFFDVTTDYLLGLTPRNDPRLINDENMTTHDRIFYFAKHRVGREDAFFMFEAAGIPIEDRNYILSEDQIAWIAAHCGVDIGMLSESGKVSLSELEGVNAYAYPNPSVFNFEEQLKVPKRAEFERRYIKLKFEKYAPLAKKFEITSLEACQKDIAQGFLSLIKQFEGNLGAQYALLDRCRKARDELVNDMHQWQDSETAVLKELA